MRTILLLTVLPLFLSGQARPTRWTAILEGGAVVERLTAGEAVESRGAESSVRRLAAEQRTLSARMESQGVQVIGASQLLLNAIYFTGSAQEAAAVRALPGVREVAPMAAYRPLADDRATDLVRAPQAWNALGGRQNAGAGRRIGILDTGIDHTHPSFQDATLAPPPDFPRANRDSDLAFTNSKVIVARSYVDRLVLGNDPTISRPDDLSARDRNGHGTAAAMLAAGVRVEGPAATISGVAPRAFLGNYKVFGSPGVNDVTFTNVIIAALEDAVRDGMDVVSVNLSTPASFGPLELCGPANQRRPCDPFATAIQNAALANVLVVVGGGNQGANAANLPALNSIESPGTAPAALTVGAFTNAHEYFQSLSVPGAPAAIQTIRGRFGNGPGIAAPLAAPMRDVRTAGDDGRGCRAYQGAALAGFLAVLERGGCDIDLKVILAQRAGAVGVILIQSGGSNQVVPLQGLTGTGIPLFLIGAGDGQQLRSYLQATPDRPGVLSAGFVQVSAPANEIAVFSSQGPSIGEFGIKPEITAVGTDLYVATQNFDPNGPRYSADRFTSMQGTSVAAPLVAGAAALIRQQRPSLTAAQVKSAIVNRADPDVTDFDNNNRPLRARVTGTGAGKLDAGAALGAQLFANPATVSFGPVTNNPVMVTRTLAISNPGSAPVTAAIRVEARDNDANARVTVDGIQSPVFQPGTTNLTVRLSGTRPVPGSYEGAILLTVGSATARVPYWYAVGNGQVRNLLSVGADNFLGFPGQSFDINEQPLLVKAVDAFGVPVADAPVRWSVLAGGGRIDLASQRTDALGIADAGFTLGSAIGEQAFQVEVAGTRRVFGGRSIPLPSFAATGVVNAATGQAGGGAAPGSYISIFGAGLAEFTRTFNTPYLPVSLSNVSVSFDVPPRSISVPGRLQFISASQINVQVPWELQGESSVQMKVSINDLSSAVVTLPLREVSPGVFEYQDGVSGSRLAAALDGASRLVSGANPVRRGQPLQLFVNGLGRVNNRPESGEVSSSVTLSETLVRPEVTIGGRPATVLFSGLAPGNVGLYQVNVVVPEDAPAGVQPLQLSIQGVSAPLSRIPVQ